MKKLFAALVMTVALLAAATIGASACTTIYVGGNLVEEGTPFVARTEDYGSDMNKMWFISEAGAFKEGDKWLGCPEYGEFEWTFTHDSYRFTYFTNDIFNGTCPECGQEDPTHWSYTEFGTNDHGVSVSATETISGNSAVKQVDPNVRTKVDGIVGIEETDIPTIILAEAASAREGIELLAEIYDTHGAFFDSGIFVCDKDEVWYIENCSGTQYVAVKLNNDMIFLEPNIAVIGEIDLDDENVIASERLIEVAQEAGTFVGDADEHIIDYRASYANLGTESSPRVGTPRMADGLKFLNADYDYTAADLYADNTKFTISNLKDGEIVPMYTNIEADRQLTKDDVFNFYKLSSVGKPSNQEIEIFQLFQDPELETEYSTVGWVGVGNMSNNVFVPYYPMLIDDMYEAYQVSTPVVTQTAEKPDSFCTWNARSGKYVVYPENWQDSYYFCFEGLGGYILYAEQIDGAPLSDSTKQYVLDRLSDLQHEFYDELVTVEQLKESDDARALATENGMAMAEKAHKLAIELINEIKWVNPFIDVKGGDWYYDAVEYTVEKGLLSGMSTNIFAPDTELSRAMVVQILYSMEGKPAVTGTSPFADVAEDAWYADAVKWAASQGIVDGVGDGRFAPEAQVTREQLALILFGYAGSPDAPAQDLTGFADAGQVSAWSADALRWAVGSNIISGKTGNVLNAQGTATRAEVAQMIMKFDSAQA